MVSFQGYPCKETCDEIERYCYKELITFLEFNVCAFYPLLSDDPTCFRPEITCGVPHVPTHGSVEFTGLTVGSEAMYDCNILFDLEGEHVRSCQVPTKFEPFG